MPKAMGLMNPENAAKSAFAFKEGWVKITACSYKVHAGKPGEGEPPIPATKWSWNVTRMQEGGEEPLTDEHDSPITEELLFSFGGKSLPFVHPGRADGPDDDDPDDMGESVGAEGNTVFLISNDWRPNEKSGLMVLTSSLAALGVAPEYLNRCWAPEWIGCVFEVKAKEGEKGRDGRAFTYKVVSKIMVGPGKGKASGNGKAPNAEVYLAPILHEMSKECEGQTLTLKAFLNRVRSSAETAKIDSKLLIPVLTLVKDDKWLQAHAETFDFGVNLTDRTITFGKLPF